MYLDNERRPTLTPQLAFRVAVIGGVALVMFALIFFRLWYLQVLSGDKYEAAGTEQPRARDQGAGAARRDRGPPRAGARREPQLALDQGHAGQAPGGPQSAGEVYRRLAGCCNLNPRRLERRVEGELKALPFSKPTVKQDVDLRLVAYVLERQSRLPRRRAGAGVPAQVPARTVGAHLFGQVGEVTEKQLKDQRYNRVALGDRVGQAGIELEYDRFLRGINGAAKVEVDALGNLTDTLRRRSRSRAASCACRSTSTSSAWPSRRWPAGPAGVPSP